MGILFAAMGLSPSKLTAPTLREKNFYAAYLRTIARALSGLFQREGKEIP
jgi:hypothetical protein